MTTLQELEKQYKDSVVGTEDPLPPVFGYLNKAGHITLLDEEIIQDLVNNHKDKMRMVLKKYLTKRIAEGEDVDAVFFFSEVYYRKVETTEAAFEEMKKNYKGLVKDPLSEEAILIYVESKESLKQDLYPIYHDTKVESRYADKKPVEVCDMRTDTKEFNTVIDNGQLVGFLPR